jgi:hypothetical protein
VHLAYLDDSDTKQKSSKLQVVSGVIVEDKTFKKIEMAMRDIRGDLITLIPEPRREEFKEFHACELYRGHGVFETIKQDNRFEAIRKLLAVLKYAEISVVYGAVNIQKVKREIYGAADPLDIAFRICMKEVYEWVRNRSLRFDIRKAEEQDAAVEAWLQELVILIVDECDPKQKNLLQSSFRTLRHPPPTVKDAPISQRLPHFHDDMFFGDSRFSIGIQLADLCCYFIARNLDGDADIKPFYEMIEPHIVFGQIYPDESTFTKPTPNLGALQQLLELQPRPHEEEQGVQQLQSGNGDDTSSQPEGGQGSDGSRETSQQTEAEGEE